LIFAPKCAIIFHSRTKLLSPERNLHQLSGRTRRKMERKTQTHFERSSAIAQQDQLRPIQGIRSDTGESIWLVRSRSHPHLYHVLIVVDEKICCQCSQYQHHSMCAHVAAVILGLRAGQQERPTASLPLTFPNFGQSACQERATPRAAEDRQWKEESLRRERALPWTDEKPFSIWRS
jgi:hypothetical protein